MHGLLAALLAAAAAPSSGLADVAPFPIERLIERLVTDVEEDGHLSQSDLRCETVLPDTGNGSLRDCVMPEFGLQSLWISDGSSDNVSISVRLADGPATDAVMKERTDLSVRNLDALFDLEKRFNRAQVPGIALCKVDRQSPGEPPTSPVVLGFRNPATGNRLILMFAIAEDASHIAEATRRGAVSDIVATILVANQLEVPCVPVSD